MRSKDPNLFGHSIRNIETKHMLIHVPENEHYPYKGKDCIRYVCIQACSTTPEKSTWNIKEVTCKNCLRELKTILHKKDWKGRTPVIYDSQIWVIPPERLFVELEFCQFCDEDLCSSYQCPYEQLITKMYNGFHDCPECGGKLEFYKVLPIVNMLPFEFLNFMQPVNFIKLMKCKLCDKIW